MISAPPLGHGESQHVNMSTCHHCSIYNTTHDGRHKWMIFFKLSPTNFGPELLMVLWFLWRRILNGTTCQNPRLNMEKLITGYLERMLKPSVSLYVGSDQSLLWMYYWKANLGHASQCAWWESSSKKIQNYQTMH